MTDWLATPGPAPPGSILFHAPATAFQAPGGGEVQLLQTARWLTALGEPVRPFCPWLDKLERAWLLHLFGMSRCGLELARVARRQGVPVALSPICWYDARSLWALGEGWRGKGRDLAAYVARRALPRRCWRSKLLDAVDLILPNSRAEAEQLIRTFGADPNRVVVVPNGVDPRFARGDPTPFRRSIGLDGSTDFVLYVGRVEPRKGVLELVRALRRTDMPLVVVGDPPPGRADYAQACRASGADRVRFVPSLRHDDPLLASAYAAARVVALVSWFETPGLAALEAGLAGRPVVVTPFGSTREYFGNHVDYARPDRPASIVEAACGAWQRDDDGSLAGHIRDHFLWPEVARRTKEAYARVAA